jgi:hypothetical protein
VPQRKGENPGLEPLRDGFDAENHPSAAKAGAFVFSQSARLKSCPFKSANPTIKIQMRLPWNNASSLFLAVRPQAYTGNP